MNARDGRRLPDNPTYDEALVEIERLKILVSSYRSVVRKLATDRDLAFALVAKTAECVHLTRRLQRRKGTP